MVGLPNTEDNRRLFRDLLLATDGIEKYLSGVILHDETFRQEALDGELFPQKLVKKGVLPGIKVDKGTVDFNGFSGEVLTEGLDGLPWRLENYASLGARFTKWRSVIRIDKSRGLPTLECIHVNAVNLARYARMAQDAGLVPIIEPEVLLEGNHTLEESRQVIEYVLSHVFYEVERLRADTQGLILKTSMVIDGADDGIDSIPTAVAQMTVEALKNSVPASVPGVVFLSGGQPSETATRNLNAIAKLEPLPWEISFSFARALQEPVLKVWKGKSDLIPAARDEFVRVLKMNIEADQGKLK